MPKTSGQSTLSPIQFKIDRDLPVSVAVQLQGQIEYGVTIGDVPLGSQLPSVRELATQLGISPVTISTAYRALQDKGLIDTTPGRGTFVRTDITTPIERRSLSQLDELMTKAIHLADREQVSRSELIQRFHSLSSKLPLTSETLTIVFVGVYADVTRAYTFELERYLAPSDSIIATTFNELTTDRKSKDAIQEADLVLTFAHRMKDLKNIVPEATPVATVKLIPSERTRIALAGIHPRSTVAIVSKIPEFLPSFRQMVARYAGHVQSVRAIAWSDTQASNIWNDIDVVVYGSGSEEVLSVLPNRIRAFEYRHTPDPKHTELILLPLINRLRVRIDSPS